MTAQERKPRELWAELTPRSRKRLPPGQGGTEPRGRSLPPKPVVLSGVRTGDAVSCGKGGVRGVVLQLSLLSALRKTDNM